jgi:hypothetical protein
VRYTLVLQWPCTSAADFDALISMEETLEVALDSYGFVYGHDFGSGEMNIFVDTDQPVDALAVVSAALGEHPRWDQVRAACRVDGGQDYLILWPPTWQGFSVT